MELSRPKIEKVFIFSQKKLSLYIWKMSFFNKILIFQEETF